MTYNLYLHQGYPKEIHYRYQVEEEQSMECCQQH